MLAYSGQGWSCASLSPGDKEKKIQGSLPHVPSSPLPWDGERSLLMRLSQPDSWLPLSVRVCAHMLPVFFPPPWLLSGSEAGSAVEVLYME